MEKNGVTDYEKRLQL